MEWSMSEYGHVSKSFWPHSKNMRHELSQTLMVSRVYKQNLTNCFLDFSQMWSGAFSSRCGVVFLITFSSLATVLFLQVDIENNFSSCCAFPWIPVNVRSYSYVEVWHRHFRIHGIIWIPVGELPCTLRESIFCKNVFAFPVSPCHVFQRIITVFGNM